MKKLATFAAILTTAGLIAACDDQPEVVEVSELETLSSLTVAAVPGDDAPELAVPGPYGVGTTNVVLTNPDQPDILNFNMITRQAPTYDREIDVDIFYPAEISPEAKGATYTGLFITSDDHVIPGLPETYQVQGVAERDATPVSGASFPLVILSHGLGQQPAGLIGISENLASKGYIVAAINHRDYTPGEAKDPIPLMRRILLFRSIDQQFVLGQLRDPNALSDAPWKPLIDSETVGLIGFSMGGYGVLNHAGAGYDPGAGPFGLFIGSYLEPLSEGHPRHENRDLSHIKAVVGISPWGARDDVNMWSDNALAQIDRPLLLLVGSEDDIVGYKDGVGRIFRQAKATDRYMLVFQNAMHNLAQIPAPPAAHLDVTIWETFEDPVWRKERLLAVNQHFITAFLDWKLKGKADRRSYLDVPTVKSNDGAWDQDIFGSPLSDHYADGTKGSERYWKGFKRRQAIGLEMHYRGKGTGEE